MTTKSFSTTAIRWVAIATGVTVTLAVILLILMYTVSMSFGKINGQTCLTIRDDGAGFDVESQLADAKMPGGLTNLKQRLNLIGCQLQVNSQSGKGTRVIILIPEE